MKYKAIIVDLDRTLLRTDKSLSDYSISVLKRCKESGIKVIVASARPLRNVVYYDSILNFDALVVSNGARILYDDKEIVKVISYDSGKKVIDLLIDNPELEVVLETGDEAYSNVKVFYFDTIVSDNLYPILKNEGALKLVVGIKDEETHNLVKSILNDDVYSTIANNYVIQVMDKEATKWNGISKVIDMIGLSSSDCIYFGDDNDDVLPLKKCGYGVAMSNAIDECKNASDCVCDSNDEDGVAHYIEEHLL